MGEAPSRVPALTALGGLVLAIASGLLAMQELGPPLAIATSPAGQFQAFASGEARLPVAEASRADLIGECYKLTRTLLARAQPTERRLRLLEACRTLALDTVAAAPTVGLAWTVAAAYSGELGDVAGFNQQLRQSWRGAPHEQWIAELRVALTEQYFASADTDIRGQEVSDLAILVQSQRGIKSLAKRYVDDLAFRERVTAVVETLPPADQVRFLHEVQAAARAEARPDVG